MAVSALMRFIPAGAGFPYYRAPGHWSIRGKPEARQEKRSRLGLALEQVFDYTGGMLPKTLYDSSVLASLRPGRYVASGSLELPSWFLSALTPALKKGGRALWLDAGNAFDAYGVSYFARAAGWDPKEILSRIDLARPFNLYQLETMVTRKVPARWRGEPIVVSDPMPLFYDEDVPAPEAKRILEKVVAGMDALPAVWLVLSVAHQAPPERAGWADLLLP
jgi:hypothetical protein